MKIITPHGMTNDIYVTKGVIQGHPLSPFLWGLFFDPLLNLLNTNVIGYRIINNQNLGISNNTFADDLVGTTESFSQISKLKDYIGIPILLLFKCKSWKISIYI
ncbi:hypothetical protein DICPUDRAFT_156738 [Dictyostelium purpureum]|uniref:Uncharacterized protein n=1 Tax=Dictyostelium purpureum TaxID=5786 RepID=F0ZXB1_DICPU|nr:uncharacterized protein DICPUDRAFT_156738 [Dictyostelium purpureum]EGC31416.1 hypothetical protein DICPUDRAFT_156738 [Dictyostelium purpureum]|eukprot:XP_003292049.1 hypothetical protein DICPUDRAFT_156738 [Dictyostelium purpureum]